MCQADLAFLHYYDRPWKNQLPVSAVSPPVISKKQCVCSPTQHPRSFRCRQHHGEYVWGTAVSVSVSARQMTTHHHPASSCSWCQSVSQSVSHHLLHPVFSFIRLDMCFLFVYSFLFFCYYAMTCISVFKMLIHDHTHLSLSMYLIYLPIYLCVCFCVCVFVCDQTLMLNQSIFVFLWLCMKWTKS